MIALSTVIVNNRICVVLMMIIANICCVVTTTSFSLVNDCVKRWIIKIESVKRWIIKIARLNEMPTAIDDCVLEWLPITEHLEWLPRMPVTERPIIANNGAQPICCRSLPCTFWNILSERQKMRLCVALRENCIVPIHGINLTWNFVSRLVSLTALCR